MPESHCPSSPAAVVQVPVKPTASHCPVALLQRPQGSGQVVASQATVHTLASGSRLRPHTGLSAGQAHTGLLLEQTFGRLPVQMDCRGVSVSSIGARCFAARTVAGLREQWGECGPPSPPPGAWYCSLLTKHLPPMHLLVSEGQTQESVQAEPGAQVFCSVVHSETYLTL